MLPRCAGTARVRHWRIGQVLAQPCIDQETPVLHAAFNLIVSNGTINQDIRIGYWYPDSQPSS
jgi:hypothetical protein